MQFLRWKRRNTKVVVGEFEIWLFHIGFWIHKLNFEIISKWFFSFVQLSLNDHNFFISALICAKFDFPSFKMIYRMTKIDFGKYSKIFPQIQSTCYHQILSFKFLCKLMNLVSCLISHVCVPSFLLCNVHYSSPKIVISLSCLSS